MPPLLYLLYLTYVNWPKMQHMLEPKLLLHS